MTSSNPSKPAEATLYDDPATADLSAKVAEAWAEFGRALALALPGLSPNTTLDITLDPTASGVGEAVYAVSISPTSGGALHAYAVSNAMLPPEHRLSRAAVGEMVALGWSPPGVLAGGDERFGIQLPTGQADRLAAIVSRTLREAYGSPHPAFLVYVVYATGDEAGSADTAGGPADEAVSSAGQADSGAGEGAVEPPALGAARPISPGAALRAPVGRADLEAMPLAEKVATVISAMLKTTPENLPVDKDGDIGIRSGSAMVFVRVRDNPPLVDVFSPVLTEVDANEQLYVKLAELTHRMPIGRLYCTNETVWASVPVFGRDFQATHLMLAVQVMTGLADELDDRLAGEFGGRRFFTDTPPGEDQAPAPGEATADARIGQYL